MLSFVVGSLATLVVVGVASIGIARDLASESALRDAALRGGAFSRTIVAPLLVEGVTDGRVNADSPLVSVLESRLDDGSVTHIKLWDRHSRVVWADEKELVGQTFPLEPKAMALFGTNDVFGDVSHLNKPENALEASEGQLLEVYAGATSQNGEPLVVETYWSMESIDDAQWALLRGLVPLVLGALLLFQLAMFPLALSLARRVDRGLAEREAMVHHALSASELERRRIAAQLHDGVIQDLAGIGFALPSIAAGLRATADSARDLLDQTHRLLLKDVEHLRALLTELHPANLGDGRLAEAVESLALRAEREGVQTRVHVAASAEQSPAVVRMAYRIVREGVQNVLKHAEASTMEVTAGPDGPDYVVRVVDDGQGFSADRPGDGHMGLQLLGATLNDLGGKLSVARGTSGGTVLEASFPASMAEILSSGPVTGSRRRKPVFLRWRKKSPRSGGHDEVDPNLPRRALPPNTRSPMIRVLLADDHPLMRLGLELAIDSAPDLVHCGSADGGIAAVAMALETKPDVVVLDVTMPGGDGIEATRRIRQLLPATRVVVLTWLESAEVEARESGADDFLLKDVPPEILLDRIRATHRQASERR
ncbi:MAG: response regulator [Actinomycetota bacterium]|nr:response regulator [Actinomycetota bacterium]